MLFDIIVAAILLGGIEAAGATGAEPTAKPCSDGEQVAVVNDAGKVLYHTCKY